MPNVYLLWEGVADHARRLFGRVRAYLNAFDAMHPRTVRAFLEAAPRRALWLQGYGQSEVGCVTVAAYTRRTVRPRPDRPPTLRDMGWASPPVTGIRVTDPDTGFPLGAGRVGQLEVHTGGRVLTYVGEEDLHARRVRGKWWTTGDMGTVSRTGRHRLNDRHVDTIDGLDSCLEIEDRLLDALPEATEVAVLKVGDRAVPVVCTVEDRPARARPVGGRARPGRRPGRPPGPARAPPVGRRPPHRHLQGPPPRPGRPAPRLLGGPGPRRRPGHRLTPPAPVPTLPPNFVRIRPSDDQIRTKFAGGPAAAAV